MRPSASATMLDGLAGKLDQLGIEYERMPGSISVKPVDESGFEVAIWSSGGDFTVHFDGWHEEFSSEDVAVRCFRLGLSPACRLAVTYRGRVASKWVLEYKEADEWIADSTTGLLVPLPGRKRVVYKQNRFTEAL